MLTTEQQEQCVQLHKELKDWIYRRARRDDEIESIADEVIVDSVLSFDPRFGLSLLVRTQWLLQNAISHYRERLRMESRHGWSGGAPKSTAVIECSTGRTVGRAFDGVPDTFRGRTSHAALWGIITRLPANLRIIAERRWLNHESVGDTAFFLNTTKRTVQRKLEQARDWARDIIRDVGIEELESTRTPEEPSADVHKAYADYLSLCTPQGQAAREARALDVKPASMAKAIRQLAPRYRSYNSIPLDAWLQQGQPAPEAARDVDDTLYVNLQRGKYAKHPVLR